MATGRPPFIKNLFEVQSQDYERGKGVAGTIRDLGAAVGTQRLGIDLTEIPPGKASSRLHHHAKKEEFFFVLTGRCRVRIGAAAYELVPGDCVSRAAGTGVPHQFFNPYEEPCSVLMMGVMTGAGVEDEIAYGEDGRVIVCDAEGNWGRAPRSKKG